MGLPRKEKTIETKRPGASRKPFDGLASREAMKGRRVVTLRKKITRYARVVEFKNGHPINAEASKISLRIGPTKETMNSDNACAARKEKEKNESCAAMRKRKISQRRRGLVNSSEGGKNLPCLLTTGEEQSTRKRKERIAGLRARQKNTSGRRRHSAGRKKRFSGDHVISNRSRANSRQKGATWGGISRTGNDQETRGENFC